MYQLKYADYHQPATLSEAINIMDHCDEEAAFMAGGSDLLVKLKNNRIKCSAVIDIKKIEALHKIEVFNDGKTVIGSLVTMNEIAENESIRKYYHLLSKAASLVGSYQVRNRATIGGNICNAAPSAETAAPLMALGAKLLIAGRTGQREVAIEEFFTGPGKNCLKHGEILEKIVIQPMCSERTNSYYIKHSPRKAMDIAAVGIAVIVGKDSSGKCDFARIALGAVAPTPIRVKAAEKLLFGKEISEDLLLQVCEAAVKAASPIGDVRASREYRLQMVGVLVKRALITVWGQL